MVDAPPLLLPAECGLLLLDQQAGLAFAVGSSDCQILLNDTVTPARTATAFERPIVVPTSAAKVYSAPPWCTNPWEFDCRLVRAG
jgi:hypothetical protein